MSKNIDEQILTQAIVHAYEEIERKKKLSLEKQEEENQKEWNRILGQKEYPDNEKWFWKMFIRKEMTL